MRSGGSRFVKVSDLRWMILMWLATRPWAHRIRALPELTAVAPSRLYLLKTGKPHKKITDWARHISQLRCWLPN